MSNTFPIKPTLAMAILAASGCSLTQPTADQIFFNGHIYTANGQQESVEALAIDDGKILFAGPLGAAKKLATNETNMVDLDGKMLLPGLHDSHIHPLLALENETCSLDEQNEFKLKEVISSVKTCLKDLGSDAPAEGNWITVSQFNGYGADSPEYLQGFADIATGLDSISSKHKIILIGADGHAYAVNHYALQHGATLLGKSIAVNATSLNQSLKNYASLIPVNSKGEPVGQLRSQAAWDLFKYETSDAADFISRADELNQYFVSNGITSAMEAWAHERDVAVYSQLAADNNLLPRISLSIVVQKDKHTDGAGGVDINKVMADVNKAKKLANGSNHLKVDSVKLMVDGVIEQPTQTAALFEPYLKADIDADGSTHYKNHDQQHEKMDRGLLEMPATEVERLVKAIDQAGYSAHFHAIGDRAVDVALTAVEKARAANPSSTAPHNIAHLQMVRKEDVPRFGKAGVFATPTPAWFAPWHAYDVSVMPYIDKVKNIYNLDELYREDSKYLERFYPIESIRKNGGMISIGSDAPVDFKGPRPFTNIMFGLLRGEWIADPANVPEEELGDDDYRWVVMNKNERMNIRDLIDAYTINGAKALQQDHIVGSLEAGKLADFIIINNDIISMAESISEDEAGNEDTETAYLMCDLAYDAEYCSTEVLATYINGVKVYEKPVVVVDEKTTSLTN